MYPKNEGVPDCLNATSRRRMSCLRTHVPPMAERNVYEQPVERFVVERMIDESDDCLGMSRERQSGGREILPVAVVSKDGCARLSLVETLLHLLRAAEFNVS